MRTIQRLYSLGRERSAKVPREKAVWWDINGCLIPPGYDPLCVRQSIESALNKSCGYSFGLEEEVAIFAIGNLIPLTPDDSEDLYYSGISMIHTDFSGLREIFGNMLSWLNDNPHPATGMLISEDPCAYSLVEGEGRSNSMLDHKRAGKPLWMCTLCDFTTDNYNDFAADLYEIVHDQTLYEDTHFPPNEIDIFLQFRKDKDRMLDMLELEQEILSSEHPDKDDPQSEDLVSFLKKDASGINSPCTWGEEEE
ncbi:unnamed protein product [Arabis nemorensis]|uniref:NYN domain-containing protein n=1 Tax=Arabis nemorensis TaxID=586526 RepID=A0A565BED1_9BRAS|nr:unnamed protein product [Arabis nemorensis]